MHSEILAPAFRRQVTMPEIPLRATHASPGEDMHPITEMGGIQKMESKRGPGRPRVVSDERHRRLRAVEAAMAYKKRQVQAGRHEVRLFLREDLIERARCMSESRGLTGLSYLVERLIDEASSQD